MSPLLKVSAALLGLTARILDGLLTGPPSVPPVAAENHLPSGITAQTFDHFYSLGFDEDSAIWMADFQSLCECVLSKYDAGVK